MREIDTETPVEWPAWCYSGDLASDILPPTSPPAFIHSNNTTILPISVNFSKNRNRRKNLCSSISTGSTPTTSPICGGAVSHDRSRAKTPNSNVSVTNDPSISPNSFYYNISASSETLQQNLQHSSFLINEKMLSERILMGFGAPIIPDSHNNNNNSRNINSNNHYKKKCDNSIPTYEKVKNEANMNSSTATNPGTSHLKNGELNATISNDSSGVNIGAANIVNSRIKKERLSPSANGDMQSSISRSRSGTPSSFHGTPPQSTHQNDTTAAQNTISQSQSTEFQSRNYSDFMRSLAAKYNNTNPGDLAIRNIFREHQKYTYNNSNKLTSKDSPSTPEIKRPPLATSSQVPLVAPLFPGLPFPTTVFPPLIDMSSTQALVTLARAAKEAELQNILRNAQKRSDTSMDQSLSPSIQSVLAHIPQHLARFNTPSLMLSAQFQSQSHENPSNRSPSSPSQYRGEPTLSVAAASGTTDSNTNIKRSSSPPLDLSSSQNSKRLKSHSKTSSPATSPPMTCMLKGQATRNVVAKEVQTLPVNTTITTNTIDEDILEEEVSPQIDLPKQHCRAQNDEINSWSVDDVYSFVNAINICAEYAQNFRDQCIDGSGLPLLTEDHLTNSLGMKLGPALKLRSILTKKLGGPCPCVSCTTTLLHHQQQQLILQHQPSLTLSSSAKKSSSPLLTSSLGLSSVSTIFTANQGANSSNSIKDTSESSTSSISAQAAEDSRSNQIRPTSTDSGS